MSLVCFSLKESFKKHFFRQLLAINLYESRLKPLFLFSKKGNNSVSFLLKIRGCHFFRFCHLQGRPRAFETLSFFFAFLLSDFKPLFFTCYFFVKVTKSVFGVEDQQHWALRPFVCKGEKQPFLFLLSKSGFLAIFFGEDKAPIVPDF